MKKNLLKQFTKQSMLLVLCFLVTAGAYAQGIVVTGKVTGESGDPLPGVTIAVKGTNSGAVSGINGEYSVAVPNTDAVLVFSFIGFNAREVPVKDKTKLDVTLKESAKSLEEVTVLGFGQTTTKQEQTAAISTIKAAEIVRTPVGDVTNAITGRMVGVMTRQPQGRPGASAAQIYIRGRASANSTALIIVDGVERETFGDIDPNDIESVSVLKDAASTALYGLKGANGVIVVTTKRGRPGKAQVTYNGSVGVNSFQNIPRPLRSYQSALLQSEAEDNMAAIGQLTHPKIFSPEDIEIFRRGDGDPLLYPDVDWMGALIRKSWMRTQHNINVSGGSNKASYFVSLGYMFEDGMYKKFNTPSGHSTTPNARRTNFRSNLDYNVTKTTTLSLNLAGRIENEYTPRTVNGQLNPGDGFATGSEALFRNLYTAPSWMMPFFPEYTDRSTEEEREKDDLYNHIRGVGFGGMIRLNPYAAIKTGGYTAQERNTLETTIKLNQKLDFLTKGLSFSGLFAYDQIANTIRLQNGAYSGYKVNRVKRNNEDPDFLEPAVAQPGVHDINDAFNTRRVETEGFLKTNIQLNLNYSRQFADHKLSGAVVATREFQGLAGGGAPRAFQGMVYRTAYNFKDKYYAEFNGAYQGSENYPAKERYGFFPTVGLGYAISEENFMRGFKDKGLDYLKLRGSIGYVGFGSTSRFVYLDGYGGITSPFYFGNPSSIGAATWDPRYNSSNANWRTNDRVPVYGHTLIGNPFVTWEKSLKRNIGLEANFLNNRIQFTTDIFDETRMDILSSRDGSTLAAYGEDTPDYNFGKNYNGGIEVELRLNNRSGAFDYGTSFQFSHIKNNRVVYDDPINQLPNLRYAGTPIGQFRGYASNGLFQSQEEVDAHAKFTGFTFMPGDIKPVDINGDGALNELDFTAIGYSDLPVDQYSMEPYVAYKGIRLSALFQAVNKVSSEFNPNDNTIQWFEHQLDRWTPNNRDTNVPALRDPSSGRNIFYTRDNLGLHEHNIQDASYIKLRNVELSYQLPPAITNRLRVQNLNIGLTGQSLYTWTKFIGFDPENNDDRSVGYYVNRGVTYPNVRTFQLNLRASF